MATGQKNSRTRRKADNLSRLGDSQLVWLYNETGERIYFSELFMRYLPLLYGTTLKYIPQEEQAKAAVKRLFDEMLELFDRTDFYGNVFRDWLYVNTTQFLEQYARENRIEEKRFFAAEADSTLSEKAFQCAAILEKANEQAHLFFESAKNGLTKAENTCVNMFFLKRKSFRSISASTGYLAGTVKKYVESGLEKIARSGDAPLFFPVEAAG